MPSETPQESIVTRLGRADYDACFEWVGRQSAQDRADLRQATDLIASRAFDQRMERPHEMMQFVYPDEFKAQPEGTVQTILKAGVQNDTATIDQCLDNLDFENLMAIDSMARFIDAAADYHQQVNQESVQPSITPQPETTDDSEEELEDSPGL